MKFLIKLVHSDKLINYYKTHSAAYKEDSGIDLFIMEDLEIAPGHTELVDLGVKCQLRSIEWSPIMWIKNKSIWKYHSYLMFPRSSISKTPLRLANSVGLCDSI